MHMYLRRGGT